MTKPTRSSATYIKFLNLVQAIREMQAFPSMDPVEERLLNQLATVWGSGEKLTVLSAMQMSPDASSATVHRRLKSLRAKGLITLVPDEQDNRVKYVTPTPLAMRYLEQMSRCLNKALKAA